MKVEVDISSLDIDTEEIKQKLLEKVEAMSGKEILEACAGVTYTNADLFLSKYVFTNEVKDDVLRAAFGGYSPRNFDDCFKNEVKKFIKTDVIADALTEVTNDEELRQRTVDVMAEIYPMIILESVSNFINNEYQRRMFIDIKNQSVEDSVSRIKSIFNSKGFNIY